MKFGANQRTMNEKDFHKKLLEIVKKEQLLTSTDIANIVKVHNQTALKHLQLLEKEGKVKSKQMGCGKKRKIIAWFME